MIKTYGDRQPGLGTSAIVGALTLAKTGTTARTATFPDAAITVAGSASALTSGRVPYVTTGGLLTDTATFGFTGESFFLAPTDATVYSSSAAQGDLGARFVVNNINNNNDRIAQFVFRQRNSAAYDCSIGASGGSSAFLFFKVLGTERLGISSTAITATLPITVPNGTSGAPGLRLTSEPSGLYRVSSTGIGMAAAGLAVARFYCGNGSTFGPYIQMESASAAEWAGILSTRTDSELRLIAGSSSAAAAQLRLYGSTHATKADRVEFTRGSTISAYFDGSGNLTVNNTTDATTTSDGSVRLSGGLSVAKNIVTGQSALFTAATAAGTTAGQLQRETNQDKMYSYANAIGGWLDKCIFSQYASVTQSGIVTDQSLASATARGTRTLPANFFKAGKVLKFRLCGRYTTDAAAGNATIQIKLGTTVFRTSGSFALDNSVTNLPWELEGEIICLTTGASGTVEGISLWKHMITGATGNYDAEALAGTTSVTLDTTASQTFDVVWTADDAGTAITCTCFRLWEVC